MMDDQRKAIIDNLSVLICMELQALSSEYWTPRYAADQMDAELKFRRERIVRLREMRAEFENTMYALQRDEL